MTAAMHHRFAPSRLAFVLAAATAGIVGVPAVATAYDDVSPAATLQWFESSWQTIEKRTPDLFMAGFGAVWTPPPGRSDQGNFSVGYDVYDRFDLGRGGAPTMYGTETGIRTMADQLHRAAVDLHVDYIINHNGYSGTVDRSTPEGEAQYQAFKRAGGYPGFFMEFFGDVDGDFHGFYEGGVYRERLAGLIDINHHKNYQAIRNPVPGYANNIAAGTEAWNGRIANIALESNRRFYPKAGHNTQWIDDPRLGIYDVPVHAFDPNDPMGGTPVEENAMGYLMRNAQWLVQVVGVDGFRIDAAKHVPMDVLENFDRAVFQSNPRRLLNGSDKHVFSYSEVYDGDKGYLMSFVRKDIDSNPNQWNDGRRDVGGNRDTLDFSLYFALERNLGSFGVDNAWNNIKDAVLDRQDDGKFNGSAGVKFVENHDTRGPGDLNAVAHAYVLMLPGNATVYFNGKEFGDNRDFPKGSRRDVLDVGRDGNGGNGSDITRLLDIRTTHGRGDYRERHTQNDGIFIYERSSSAVVGVSNRGDRGYDMRTVEVDFAEGTHLIELTGNHTGWTDPYNDEIKEVVTVYKKDGKNVVDITVPRNVNANGDVTRRGYVVYGLPTPQATNGLEIIGASGLLAGDDADDSDWLDGRQRQTDVQVVTGDQFSLKLQTREVRLLGSDSLRDIWADGDNAQFKINGGLDINGNGYVDHTTPNKPSYGFEQFGTTSSPLIGKNQWGQPDLSAPRGNGLFQQNINSAQLGEGYHYITARAYRHRTDNGPEVFSEWKKVIYIDRLKPVSGVDSNKTVIRDGTEYRQDRDFFFKSLDKTADNMHVFWNLPGSLTDQQIKGLASGDNRAEYWDRDVFKKYFGGMQAGNHVFTILTFEITGNWNVQRIAGINIDSPIGRGLGDANFDQQYEGNDLEIIRDAILQQDFFNPAADFNADGWINLTDWNLLGDHLEAIHASGAKKSDGFPLVSDGTLNYYYDLTSSVPEPAALGLVALAGLTLRRRRK
jgi:alpha-amylase